MAGPMKCRAAGVSRAFTAVLGWLAKVTGFRQHFLAVLVVLGALDLK